MTFITKKEVETGHKEVIDTLQEEQKKMKDPLPSGGKSRRVIPSTKKEDPQQWMTPPVFVFYPSPEELSNMILNAAHVTMP